MPSGSSGPYCAREGCRRRINRNSRYQFCSVICSSLVKEFDALRWLPAVGTPEGTEAWTKLVEVADLWAEYQLLQRAVYLQGQGRQRLEISTSEHEQTNDRA